MNAEPRQQNQGSTTEQGAASPVLQQVVGSQRLVLVADEEGLQAGGNTRGREHGRVSEACDCGKN